jgi:hypothetical protein
MTRSASGGGWGLHDHGSSAPSSFNASSYSSNFSGSIGGSIGDGPSMGNVNSNANSLFVSGTGVSSFDNEPPLLEELGMFCFVCLIN